MSTPSSIMQEDRADSLKDGEEYVFSSYTFAKNLNLEKKLSREILGALQNMGDLVRDLANDQLPFNHGTILAPDQLHYVSFLFHEQPLPKVFAWFSALAVVNADSTYSYTISMSPCVRRYKPRSKTRIQ